MRAHFGGEDVTEAVAVACFELEATGFLCPSVESDSAGNTYYLHTFPYKPTQILAVYFASYRLLPV